MSESAVKTTPEAMDDETRAKVSELASAIAGPDWEEEVSLK